MNPFDGYTTKARIAPAVLVLLPLVVTVYAWLPPIEEPWMLTWLAPAAIGLLILLSVDTRKAGQRLQMDFFKRWGGAPTTILLRHADKTVSSADKARYHSAISKLYSGPRLPDAVEEKKDPSTVDTAYDTAVNWLREQTRDQNRFPLVADENATYGFYRNLYALREIGGLTSIVGLLASGTLLLFPHTGNGFGRVFFALAISGVCGIVIMWAAREEKVREAAFAYAITLLRATDALPNDK